MRSIVVNMSIVAEKQTAPRAASGRRREEIEPPEEQPENLPIPADAIIQTEPLRPSSSSSSAARSFNALSASPLAAASFRASNDNGDIPPDTHGAVGLQHLMTVHNGRVRIQDKAGNIISSVLLTTFWAALSSSALDVFDPKVVYDPLSNRWVMISCAERRSAGSSILVGVSQTSDPTANWTLYRLDADPANILWADYPSIGFNKDWIVIQANMFPVNDAVGVSASKVFVLNKANFYNGGPGLFTDIALAGIGQTQTPALTYDRTLATLYLVQDFNGNSGGSGFLRLYAITGALGSERIDLTPSIFSGTPNPWASTNNGGVDFAPQQSSSRKIQTNDSRIQSVVYRNGSLWCAHTVFLPAGNSPVRSALQWWELSTTGAVRQRGRIEDTTGATFYAFPSIAVNKFNDVLLGFSRYSPTQYASANYAFRAASDAPNTMRDDAVLKSGEASYYKTYSSGKNRWGDYSNTVVDPANDTDLWTIQEYAATSATASCSSDCDRWGTWWGRIAPNSPPVNQLDDPQFFVGQHYRDFLNREPDSGGLGYWSGQINNCADAACVIRERINVSAAFFVENEFQRTGSFVYRFYKASYGARPTFTQFTSDRRLVPEGPQLEASKQAFAAAWVARPEFLQRYPLTLDGASFTDALLNSVRQNSGVDLSGARAALIADYAANQSRARIVRLVADNPAFQQAEYNAAFVLMQYFGYLQRNPDEGGYQFWLGILNDRVPNNYRAMVCAFITSGEYQQRFGSVITHTDAECGP
ncbi:MAG: hypothetical protein QOF02_531 [Blastocatellia bacterium]|nr:hypothetical protein [Blastocatellia bacterium]